MRAHELTPLEEISAHDLVQPLTAIKLEAQMLARRVRGGEVTLADIAAMLDEMAARTGVLAERLAAQLSLTRASAEALWRGQCELMDLVRSVLAAMDCARAERVVVIGPESAAGSWDAERLSQLLRNLLDNALKYSDQSSAVTLRVSDGPDDVMISVQDGGIGLTADELPRVFARGYRSTRAAGTPGVGFGLAGCRAIAEAHGGRIWAESDGPGKGARFVVTLPRFAS